jgi:type IV secretion system protein VirB11
MSTHSQATNSGVVAHLNQGTQESGRSDPTSLLEYMGPLRSFLDDPHVTEICVNRPGEVYTESRKGWQRHECADLNFFACNQIAQLTATFARQRINEESNLLSAQLPHGERVQFVIPPACEAGTVSITIRKPSKMVKTLEEMELDGVFTSVRDIYSDKLLPDEEELLALKSAGRYREFIQLAVQSRKNIVISGATGAGKTTLMRAMVGCIPAQERLVTIEDVHELPLPGHPNRVHLFYSKDGQGLSKATPKQLLESCLRMKPDRILLAELRSDEAFYYLRNVNSGHPGSITSIHANSAKLAIEQLGLLVKESAGGSNLSRDDIKSLLYMLVDVVVQFKNIAGRRVMTEVFYDPALKRKHMD